jgi:hypothetical protein
MRLSYAVEFNSEFYLTSTQCIMKKAHPIIKVCNKFSSLIYILLSILSYFRIHLRMERDGSDASWTENIFWTWSCVKIKGKLNEIFWDNIIYVIVFYNVWLIKQWYIYYIRTCHIKQNVQLCVYIFPALSLFSLSPVKSLFKSN